MVPDKELEYKIKLNKLVTNPISDGIDPVSLLVERFNTVNCVNNPISVGMDPVKSLADGSNNVKVVRDPISVGIVPVKAEIGVDQDDNTLDDVKIVMGESILFVI